MDYKWKLSSRLFPLAMSILRLTLEMFINARGLLIETHETAFSGSI